MVVTAVDDLIIEGDETVTVTLRASTAYAIGYAYTATATIRDDDALTVSVASPDANNAR